MYSSTCYTASAHDLLVCVKALLLLMAFVEVLALKIWKAFFFCTGNFQKIYILMQKEKTFK